MAPLQSRQFAGKGALKDGLAEGGKVLQLASVSLDSCRRAMPKRRYDLDYPILLIQVSRVLEFKWRNVVVVDLWNGSPLPICLISRDRK